MSTEIMGQLSMLVLKLELEAAPKLQPTSACIVSTIRCSISNLIFFSMQWLKALMALIIVNKPSVSILETELISRSL